MDTSFNTIICYVLGVCLGTLSYIVFSTIKKRQHEEIQMTKNGISIRYHYFVWFLFLPIWIVSYLYDYAVNYEIFNNFPLNLFGFAEFVCAILFIFSYIGFFKFTKYSWVTLVSGITLYLITRAVLEAVLFIYDASFSTDSLYLIPNFVLRILTILYYFKRKKLFIEDPIFIKKRNKKSYDLDGFTESESIHDYGFQNTVDESENIGVEKDNPGLISKTEYANRFCRMCGTELDSGSLYCRKCGTKKVLQHFRTGRIQIKKCSKCGKELLFDSEFCQYCGSNDVVNSSIPSKITKLCTECNSELPDDSAYCAYCGSKELREKEVPFPDTIECPNCYYKLIPLTETCPNCNYKLANTKTRTKEKNGLIKKRLVIISTILLIIAVSAVGIYYYDPGEEISFRNGEIIDKYDFDASNYSNSKSSIIFVAPKNQHVYVCVKLHSRFIDQHIEFLIKGGESYNLFMPGGSYDLYFATGNKWQGTETLFGKRTECFHYRELLTSATIEFDTVFDFGANTNYNKISKEEFLSQLHH